MACPGEREPPTGDSTPRGESAPPDDSVEPDDTADSDDTAEGPTVEAAASLLDLRDYGFLYWPGNHWTQWGSYETVRHVLTGFYGLALDVASADLVHLGIIADAASAEEALVQDAAVVAGLPAGAVRYGVTVTGEEHVATSFTADGGDTNPSRLIDMGRVMQRVEVPELGYDGDAALAGSVPLAAMTRHFVLTHRAAPTDGASALTVSIDLAGDAVANFPETRWLEGERALTVHDAHGTGWTFIVPEQEGAVPGITRSDDGGLGFSAAFADVGAGEEVALSVIAVPSTAASDEQFELWLHPGESVTVRYAQLARDGSGGEALTEASREPVSQAVEGTDWWQARDDPASGGFGLSFNLPNRGTQRYRLVR